MDKLQNKKEKKLKDAFEEAWIELCNSGSGCFKCKEKNPQYLLSDHCKGFKNAGVKNFKHFRRCGGILGMSLEFFNYCQLICYFCHNQKSRWQSLKSDKPDISPSKFRDLNKLVLKELKLSMMGCRECKKEVTEATLPSYEFHHPIPSGKLYTMANIWKEQPEDFLTAVILELFFCELLCANCHRDYHSN